MDLHESALYFHLSSQDSRERGGGGGGRKREGDSYGIYSLTDPVITHGVSSKTKPLM